MGHQEIRSPARRTQAERSAATRGRLLDATIECLVEFGYAGTTVARIAQRAHVTRGAQVHHFPTKEALVLAAVGHLAELGTAETVRKTAGLGTSADWVGTLLELLWELHRDAVAVAIAEVWVAARTDPQLAQHVAELDQRPAEGIAAGADAETRQVLLDPAVLEAIFTAMDAMRGLVLSSWHLSPDEVTSRWHRLKRHLLIIFPAVVRDVAP